MKQSLFLFVITLCVSAIIPRRAGSAVWLRLLIILSLFGPGSQREIQSAEPAAGINLTIDLDHAHPLSQDLYGANTEALHLPVWFDQPAFAEKYNAIGRPFIRFPGGTPSNFYNPQTGLFDDDSPSGREYGDQNKKLLKITKGAGLTPEPFFQFAKEQNLRYSLVLNVCTRSFEENKAWLEQLAKAGHKIPAIEIGNEVFYGGYQWAFPKPVNYLQRARKLTEVIRRLFPGTKVGVVFPNTFYQDETLFDQGDREKPSSHYKWMKMLEGEDFYDAIIIHLYSLIGMSNATEPEDFIPHLEAYKNVIAMLESRLDPTFEELASRFPGKELWITEYGVGGFGGNLKQYALRYSHLGALHTDLNLASGARFSAGVQLIHRTDMPLEQAMQDTERCERVELSPAQLEPVALPPYSITQLEVGTP